MAEEKMTKADLAKLLLQQTNTRDAFYLLEDGNKKMDQGWLEQNTTEGNESIVHSAVSNFMPEARRAGESIVPSRNQFTQALMYAFNVTRNGVRKFYPVAPPTNEAALEPLTVLSSNEAEEENETIWSILESQGVDAEGLDDLEQALIKLKMDAKADGKAEVEAENRRVWRILEGQGVTARNSYGLEQDLIRAREDAEADKESLVYAIQDQKAYIKKLQTEIEQKQAALEGSQFELGRSREEIQWLTRRLNQAEAFLTPGQRASLPLTQRSVISLNLSSSSSSSSEEGEGEGEGAAAAAELEGLGDAGAQVDG